MGHLQHLADPGTSVQRDGNSGPKGPRLYSLGTWGLRKGSVVLVSSKGTWLAKEQDQMEKLGLTWPVSGVGDFSKRPYYLWQNPVNKKDVSKETAWSWQTLKKINKKGQFTGKFSWKDSLMQQIGLLKVDKNQNIFF